jgi:drug/metabolite transporter (DMT)-like permease/proteasome lid subunit RPN8/RPN11
MGYGEAAIMAAERVGGSTVPPDRKRVAARTGSLALVSVYVLVCLIWGTNWVAIKFAVTDMPAMLASGLRFLVAAPVLIVICIVKKVPLRFPRGLGWFGVYVTFGYFCIPFLLYNVAEQYISSGLTAICFAMVSVLMVVLSVPILGDRLTARQIMGVPISFGALVLLVANEQHLTAKSMWGVAAALTAAAMHALAYLIIKKHGAPVHALTLDTIPIAVSGVLLTGIALLIDHPAARMFTLRSVLATVHLGLVASVIGLVVYFWLLQRISAVTASFIFLIFPVIAQAVSAGRGEARFQPVDVALMAAILGGFALAQAGPRFRGAGAAGAVPDVPRPVTDEILRRVYEHAVRSYPSECCGFIRRSGVRECANAVAGSAVSDRTARTGYAFNAADTRELHDSIGTDDPALVVYHSHPDVGAYMSAEDQRFAVLDGMPVLPVDHLVIDVTAGGVREAKLFRFDDRSASYTQALVYPGPAASYLGGAPTRAGGTDA